MKRKKSTIVKAWLPVIIWMGVIFLFSHQPGDVSGASSGKIVALISSAVALVFSFIEINEDMLHFLLRKGAHFGVYAILGILSVRAFQISGFSGKRGIFYGWMLATLYAGTDEFHQTFIPGRSGEVTDVMIDSAGAIMGISAYILAKGIQVPTRVGKNTLQYILIQDGREEEIQKEQQKEQEKQEKEEKEEKDQKGVQKTEQNHNQSESKASGKMKEYKNDRIKVGDYMEDQVPNAGSGAKAVRRLKDSQEIQEKKTERR